MFDEWPMLEQLPDEELGKLIRAVVQYEMTGEVIPLPQAATIAFLSVKRRIDRAETVRAQKSAAGKKGMAARYGKVEAAPTSVTVSNNDVITDHNIATAEPSTSTISEVTGRTKARERARVLWQQGRRVNQISAELGVPQTTVSSWKHRDKWAAVE